MKEDFNMTIRKAIELYFTYKSHALSKDIGTLERTTCLCFTIPLNNGVFIFIDTHTNMKDFKDKYPLKYPNKNNVFKRVSFEIMDIGKPVLPRSILKYTSESPCNDVLYFVDTAKERAINEFINANGGIDEEKLNKEMKDLWKTE